MCGAVWQVYYEEKKDKEEEEKREAERKRKRDAEDKDTLGHNWYSNPAAAGEIQCVRECACVRACLRVFGFFFWSSQRPMPVFILAGFVWMQCRGVGDASVCALAWDVSGVYRVVSMCNLCFSGW